MNLFRGFGKRTGSEQGQSEPWVFVFGILQSWAGRRWEGHGKEARKENTYGNSFLVWNIVVGATVLTETCNGT